MVSAEKVSQGQEDSGLRVFHWILTLQWARNGSDLVTESQSGTVNIGPGATRTQVLKQLRDACGTPSGFAGPGVVLFFSLEPESISHYFAASPEGD